MFRYEAPNPYPNKSFFSFVSSASSSESIDNLVISAVVLEKWREQTTLSDETLTHFADGSLHSFSLLLAFFLKKGLHDDKENRTYFIISYKHSIC